MYFSNSASDLARQFWHPSDTKISGPCASWRQNRVQGVCQFLLMVTLTYWHAPAKIPVMPTGLAVLGTPVSVGGA